MIHETAIIDPGAELGKDVGIGPFTTIETDVNIGDGTVIGPNVSIMPYTSIGPHCHIHAGAVLGGVPQDVDFEGERSFITIGANCQIREGVTINRGTKADSVTEIGDDCFLMAFSHFAHNVKLGHGVVVVNGALLAGYVEIGDQVVISGNCVLHQFVKVGRLVILGGGCAVTKDVPPFCMLKPLEINKILGLNTVGLRRSTLTTKERQEIKEGFKLLFCSGLNVGEALKRISSTFPSGPAAEFSTFVDKSKRGICRM